MSDSMVSELVSSLKCPLWVESGHSRPDGVYVGSLSDQYLVGHNKPSVRSEQSRLEYNNGRAPDSCKEKREATSPRKHAKGRERSSSCGLGSPSTGSSRPGRSTYPSLGAVKTLERPQSELMKLHAEHRKVGA